MYFEPQTHFARAIPLPPDVHTRDDGDAEREWNAAFLEQWCEPLPEPSDEQQPVTPSVDPH